MYVYQVFEFALEADYGVVFYQEEQYRQKESFHLYTAKARLEGLRTTRWTAVNNLSLLITAKVGVRNPGRAFMW